jgi:hypothetical protein
VTYTQQQWADDNISAPYGPLSADRLNHIEAGIAAVANGGSIASLNLKTLYGIAPGQDITTALQGALNTIAAGVGSTYANGAEIVIPDPGVYTVHGASQTGTAQSYSYAGQVLIPAVALASTIPVLIRGGVRASGGYSTTGAPNGVVLQSNATSGYVFDIIPSFTEFGCPWTGIMVLLEDLIVRCPDNPTCGGINLLCTQRAKLERVIVDTPTTGSVLPSGSLEGIVMPQIYNNGDVTVRDVQVHDFPVGVRLSEHGVFDNVQVTHCAVAFKGGGRSHANWFGYVDVEECPTIFDGGVAPAFGSPAPVAGSMVYGTLDFENTNRSVLAPVNFVNDTTTNRVYGKLDLWGTISGTHPVTGGRGLDLVPVNATPSVGPVQRAAGWYESNPYDNFTREVSLSGTGAPGQCSPSLHPWRVEAGSFSVSGGKLQGLTGAPDKCFVPVRRAASWGAHSRTITCTFTLGATSPLLRIYANAIVTTGEVSANGGVNAVELKIAGGAQPILRAQNTNIVGAGSTLAAGSTHTVKLTVYHDATGYPYRAKAYIDGTLIADTSIANLFTSNNPSIWPYWEDGLSFGDTGTAVTLFAVQDITLEPPQDITTAVTYSASMTPDCRLGRYQTINASNTTAFTINNPTNAPVGTETAELTIEIQNSSGGALGAVTWGSAFNSASWTFTAPANGKKRAFHFRWNGSSWVYVNQSGDF